MAANIRDSRSLWGHRVCCHPRGMPNIQVRRRAVALTVGAMVALMPMASYAQMTDHAAAELANSKARCQMLARGDRVPGHPTDCARLLSTPAVVDPTVHPSRLIPAN